MIHLPFNSSDKTNMNWRWHCRCHPIRNINHIDHIDHCFGIESTIFENVVNWMERLDVSQLLSVNTNLILIFINFRPLQNEWQRWQHLRRSIENKQHDIEFWMISLFDGNYSESFVANFTFSMRHLDNGQRRKKHLVTFSTYPKEDTWRHPSKRRHTRFFTGPFNLNEHQNQFTNTGILLMGSSRKSQKILKRFANCTIFFCFVLF